MKGGSWNTNRWISILPEPDNLVKPLSVKRELWTWILRGIGCFRGEKVINIGSIWQKGIAESSAVPWISGRLQMYQIQPLRLPCSVKLVYSFYQVRAVEYAAIRRGASCICEDCCVFTWVGWSMKGKDEEDIRRLCHIWCSFCGMMWIMIMRSKENDHGKIKRTQKICGCTP